MTLTAVVLARFSSKRLPGKVMRPVSGKPVLQYLWERLSHCPSVEKIIVATSVDPTDDPIVEFCKAHAIECYRGPLDNAALRVREVIKAYGLQTLARVNGDSPLLDTALIDQAANLMATGKYDVVTNVLIRTYPPGESVELVQALAFEKGYALAKDPSDREHVMPVFYQHPDIFRIFNIQATPPYRNIHLAVDTPRDMEIFEGIIAAMDKPHWEYGLKEIIPMYKKLCQTVSST